MTGSSGGGLLGRQKDSFPAPWVGRIHSLAAAGLRGLVPWGLELKAPGGHLDATHTSQPGGSPIRAAQLGKQALQVRAPPNQRGRRHPPGQEQVTGPATLTGRGSHRQPGSGTTRASVRSSDLQGTGRRPTQGTCRTLPSASVGWPAASTQMLRGAIDPGTLLNTGQNAPAAQEARVFSLNHYLHSKQPSQWKLQSLRAQELQRAFPGLGLTRPALTCRFCSTLRPPPPAAPPAPSWLSCPHGALFCALPTPRSALCLSNLFCDLSPAGFSCPALPVITISLWTLFGFKH